MAATALIVAAGRGTRAGGDALPKQYRHLGASTVLAHSITAFQSHPAIGAILVVIHPDDRARYEASLPQAGKLLAPVSGALTRQGSVLAGLEGLTRDPPEHVLIHDAARPFLDGDLIDRVIGALAQAPGVVPGLPVTDTIRRADSPGFALGTIDRSGLWRVQTPQGFDFSAILTAHRQAADAGRHDFTDDAAVLEWAGTPVLLVPGAARNRKLTTPEDFAMAATETAWRQAAHLADIRTGSGFDVHRFCDGGHVMLCGVRVAHDRGLEGHSDADAALHALTDALLGAIGDGDIGQHFPPSDARWRGADSALFLAEAARRIRALGGVIAHVDLTLICEGPRISPHRQAMRERLAEILAIEVSRTSVKATTSEGLGFPGRREGLAAMATATVRLPLR